MADILLQGGTSQPPATCQMGGGWKKGGWKKDQDRRRGIARRKNHPDDWSIGCRVKRGECKKGARENLQERFHGLQHGAFSVGLEEIEREKGENESVFANNEGMRSTARNAPRARPPVGLHDRLEGN